MTSDRCRRRRLAAGGLVAVSLLLPTGCSPPGQEEVAPQGPAGASSPSPGEHPGAEPFELWQRLTLEGAPAGTVHTRSTTREDGRRVTTVATDMRLARMGQLVTLGMEQSEVDGPDGRLEELSLITNMPAESRTVARVVGSTLEIEQTGASSGTRRLQQPWPDDVRSTESWRRELVAWLPTADVGDSLDTVQFDLSLDGRVVHTYTVERIDVDAWELALRTDALPQLQQSVRLDASGRLLRHDTRMLGMDFTLEACSRDVALASLDEASGGQLSAEIFEQTLLRPDIPLPRPRSLDRLVLRIEPKDPSQPLPDFESPRQRVLDRDARGLVLEIRRVGPGEGRGPVAAGDPTSSTEALGTALGQRTTPSSPNAPVDGPGLPIARGAGASAEEPPSGPPRDGPPSAEDLAANATIESDDAAVMALARRAVADGQDGWQRALALERAVHRHIEHKSLGVAFASAAETCRSRSGDCSEHAVLLAAVCRAQGLPARVAMGLVYLGGIFGGHAWTEVWIDDRWLALDATQGLGAVDATHLRFASSDMAGVGMGVELLSASLGLANLDISVLEIELDGVTRPADQLARRALEIDGARLTSTIHGVSLQAPAGFAWEDRIPDWSEGVLARARGPGDRRLLLTARAVDYAFVEGDLVDELSSEAPRLTPRVQGRAAALGWSRDRGAGALRVLDGDTVLSVLLIGEPDDDVVLELLMGLADSLRFEG